MKNIYLTYQLVGVIIIIFNFENFYVPWLYAAIPLSILGFLYIPKDFLIYKLGNFFSSDLLKFAAFLSIILSFFNAALYLDLTLIPSFLLVSLASAYYYTKDFSTFDKYFKLIAYIASAIIFIKYIIFGMGLGDIFMFSKNIIPVVFIPYIYSFLKRDFLKNSIVDFCILTFILFVFVMTISVSNIIFTFGILIALLFPKEKGLVSFLKSKWSYKFLILSILSISIGLIYFSLRYTLDLQLDPQFLKEQGILSNTPSVIRSFLISDSFTDPRFDLWTDYFQFDNVRQLIFGKHLRVFEYFDNSKEIFVPLVNPHNSLIVLHNTCGIFGLIIFMILLISSLKILFSISFSQGIFLLAILLRSSSDSILIVSGVSAFIIFSSLFQKDKLKFINN